MTKKSSSKAEDERREPESAVAKKHGGVVVESIAPEDLESFNDADCKHVKRIKVEDDDIFTTYECANPSCNEVFLYDKGK